MPECARLSGNYDEAMDDKDLQKALEDSSREAEKQRHQGKYVSQNYHTLSLLTKFRVLQKILTVLKIFYENLEDSNRFLMIFKLDISTNLKDFR